ncbi:MAG: phosphoribosylformylglycinamidine synthase subunit PurQ, partial [Nanoarchaeota archaeon]|nr:phosphoribosylformylglycinamidine synthase subunit PurQ [Nanoarchaeota archaeon]
MADPRVMVLSGYGINCQDETEHAFRLAGVPDRNIKRVHINDLVTGADNLKNYQIAAFDGGFSWGDDTGSGNALAWKIRNNLGDSVYEFVHAGKLIIGICNGYQALSNLGMFPIGDADYGDRQVALKHNKTARFMDRWVDLEAEGKSPWVQGIRQAAMPIRHGEGNFYASPEVLSALESAGQVAFRYVRGSICDHFGYEANPNGSMNDIAGITDPSGRVLGMMPHPEAAVDVRQDPRYTLLREQCMRAGVEL